MCKVLKVMSKGQHNYLMTGENLYCCGTKLNTESVHLSFLNIQLYNSHNFHTSSEYLKIELKVNGL